MQITTVVLALPLLASGALHSHAKAHKRAHALVARDVKLEVVTITEIVTVTVDGDATSTSTAPIALVSLSSAPAVVLISFLSRPPTNLSQPTSSAVAKPALSSKTAEDKGVSPYPTLVPVAGSAMIKNSCGYPVYVWSDGDPSCEGPAAKGKLVEANGTHIEFIRKCSTGGISLKVSKNNSAAKPMQFEYAVWESDKHRVSYDISYLNCMKNENGEKDLSECAGHDGGIQAAGGSDCDTHYCLANKWCDVQAYVVAEFGYQDGAPVPSCEKEKGIAFELCASNRV
jgi:hypothetical protein